ncbi:hypothetical protein HK097_007213 [Rhizophlyctis rosea]|uniref:4Fe-4S Mo/W bis-MGD-type domain-containing protein n=1 Tax=Rhizophlyctis rosea TaxID=64517 RepID=A0AAD5SJI0_9FUNG|nr:hypothetical protein HK097_007213 [Rhizophlyctis rosea]
MCSNGCGLDIAVKDKKIVGVRGLVSDRVNHGRLGPKGLHSWEPVHNPDRLTHPLIRKNGVLVKASWDEAMELICAKTREVMHELGKNGIAFYTSGQLFLEEYYTLALVAKAGICTMHTDGNTRLCTATAAAAMRESFGCDGQPGSYTDIDYTDCIMIFGHNIANTQTVLWTRMLDRLKGPNPPKLIVVDPRKTRTAQEADLHLKPKVGTNMALLNGIQHLMIKNGWINKEWVDKHTIGYDELARLVSSYTPEKVSEITGIPASDIIKAAEILGKTPTLLSTALQGVYQSHQATASACQINNIHLIRGMIGKPGCGILQMNGQPTAQNNRETGCDGEYTGFRNPENKQHMQDLADHWNVDVEIIPHWMESPTHISQIMSFIRAGSVKFMWISGTNPAVSLPHLSEARETLRKPDLFVVAQDIFPNETTELASVVLPAAMWGEKTGTFTNVDRTVHISDKAVDPPGECRSDMDIWIDYARRMGFKDKDGNPLIKWNDSEGAFEHWKASTKGRPCDYSGMTYDLLRKGTGLQWPCNDEFPHGCERLYQDGTFPTDIDHCETYGHDLELGAPFSKEEYAMQSPAGRAIIRSAQYRPPQETVNEDYPFWVSTGRDLWHFHTRTKTRRMKHLQDRQPDAYVQINEKDAEKLGIKEGDMVRVTSRRGEVQVKACIGRIDQGTVFVPFHYGYFDSDDKQKRAANELTISGWDPISKQPYFKFGAVKVAKVEDGDEVPTLSARDSTRATDASDSGKAVTEGKHMHIGDYIAISDRTAETLKKAFTELHDKFPTDRELQQGMQSLHHLADEITEMMDPFMDKYDCRNAPIEALVGPITPLHFTTPVTYGAMVAIHSLMPLIASLEITCKALNVALQSLLDPEFALVMRDVQELVRRMGRWVTGQTTTRSVQALTVPL